jgi:hypothetical protein
LIKKIEDLIPLGEELNKRGIKGYELVKKKFEWKNIINNFKTIMIETIKNKIQN